MMMMTAVVVMERSVKEKLDREDHATAMQVAGVYTTSRRVYRGQTRNRNRRRGEQ